MKNIAKTNSVVFNESVKFLFFELIDDLFQKEYFGFLNEAKEYVLEIEQYFKSEIPKLHQLGLNKKAMPYFEKNMGKIYFLPPIEERKLTQRGTHSMKFLTIDISK